MNADEFFAGVDEVRTYLDRHIQDPERRRARLARIAGQLLRPRGCDELAAWLATQMLEALGAEGCAMWLHDGDWRLWRWVGREQGAEHIAPAVFEQLEQGGAQPFDVDGAIVVPVCGADGVLAALWLRNAPAMDPGSAALVQAIADTAGIALEQALKIDSLQRDPLTGLRTEAGFVAGVQQRLAAPPAPAGMPALLAVRLVGLGDVQATQGQQAAQRLLSDLCRAAQAVLPADVLLGTRAGEVVALVPGLPDDEAEAEAEMRRLCRAVNRAVQHRAVGGSLHATTAVFVLEPAADAVTAVLERMHGRLASGAAGGAQRLGG